MYIYYIYLILCIFIIYNISHFIYIFIIYNISHYIYLLYILILDICYNKMFAFSVAPSETYHCIYIQWHCVSVGPESSGKLANSQSFCDWNESSPDWLLHVSHMKPLCSCCVVPMHYAVSCICKGIWSRIGKVIHEDACNCKDVSLSYYYFFGDFFKKLHNALVLWDDPLNITMSHEHACHHIREPGFESCAVVLKPWARFSLYIASVNSAIWVPGYRQWWICVRAAFAH